MKAFLKNYRQAPRKVRLVADAVRGKKVSDALNSLEFMNKRAAPAVGKLIRSAVANAKQKEASADEDKLFVENIQVNKGFSFRRYRMRARGSIAPIHKETSHISLTLGTK